MRSIGLGCRGWGWAAVLVASGFDDLVGQTGRIRKDQLMAARHLHQPVQSEPARHPGMPTPLTRRERNIVAADQIASRRVQRAIATPAPPDSQFHVTYDIATTLKLHASSRFPLRHVTAQGNRLVTAISKSRATYKLSQSIGGGTCFGAVAVEGFC